MLSSTDTIKLQNLNESSRSLRQFVDLKCKDCIYDSAEPGHWRMQVENCSTTECPLHKVRPFTYQGNSKARRR